MWLGVLRRAIFDFVLYKGVRAKSVDWKRARLYIFTDGVRCDEDGLSCEEVCGCFGWDVDYVRRLVRNLVRADVRKLEASRFKEEFMLSIIEAAVECTLRWDSGSAAPFLTNRQYLPEYREPFTARRVSVKRTDTAPPLVRWGEAA